MSPMLTRLGVGRGGFGFGRRATSPIYIILPSVSSLNEGSPITFNVNTINVQSGTTLYWTINSVSGTVNASDFNEGVSGSFVISGNTGSVVLNVSNDATTEGSETFEFQVRTGSTAGPIVATSSVITVGDTSLTPTYSVSPSSSSVNEGSSVTFTTTTTNVPNSTTLYWTLSTISGTINSSDFSGGATSGSFTITSNSGSVVLTLANDLTTEGSESFQFQVRTGSTSGTVVATSTTVTINDTSLAFSATGGTTFTPGNGYTYHIFTSPGTFSVNNGSRTFNYFVVGAGGGGANGGAGGGGALSGSFPATGPVSYPITIGSGGTNAPGAGAGTDGGNTVAFSVTAYGGTRAGPGGAPGVGGGQASGSGGGNSSSPQSGGPGGPQGFSGSPNIAGDVTSGGGGGAGGAGGPGSASTGGLGVVAFSGDTGVPASYGQPGPTAGRWFAYGGFGGGPAGRAGVNPSQGSGGSGSNPGNSTAGQPGIVIVRYLV